MDIPRADLPLLVSLDALLRESNVSRAAATLGMSQPALSAQLARLRDLFGDPLLVQSGRRMVPTTRAEAIRTPLRSALADLGAVVAGGMAFDPATSIRTFRIAAPDFLHAAVVAPALAGLATGAPGLRIAHVAHANAWRGMEEDRVHLLLTSQGTTPDGAVGRALFDERFVAVQRIGHPRGRGPLDLDAFCAAEHLLIALSEGAFRGPVDDTLALMGRSRRVTASVTSFLLAPFAVAQSDRIAVIPETVAQLFGHLLDAFEPPLDQAGFPVRLSWHPRHAADPGVAWLRERIAEERNRMVR